MKEDKSKSKVSTVEPPLMDTSIQWTDPYNWQILLSQRSFLCKNKPPHSGHFSSMDKNIVLTSVRYMEVPLYVKADWVF